MPVAIATSSSSMDSATKRSSDIGPTRALARRAFPPRFVALFVVAYRRPSLACAQAALVEPILFGLGFAAAVEHGCAKLIGAFLEGGQRADRDAEQILGPALVIGLVAFQVGAAD